ncbi:hypothetical protein GEMRC1_012772 [Eukaryota sp. GEM-RC1]
MSYILLSSKRSKKKLSKATGTEVTSIQPMSEQQCLLLNDNGCLQTISAQIVDEKVKASVTAFTSRVKPNQKLATGASFFYIHDDSNVAAFSRSAIDQSIETAELEPLHTFGSPSTILNLSSSLYNPFVTVSTDSNGLYILSDDLQVIHHYDIPTLCSSPVSNDLVLTCSSSLLSLLQVSDGELFDSISLPESSSRYIRLLRRSESDFLVLVASPNTAILCTFSLDLGFTSSFQASFPAPVACFAPHSLQQDDDDNWSFCLSYVAVEPTTDKSTNALYNERIHSSSFTPFLISSKVTPTPSELGIHGILSTILEQMTHGFTQINDRLDSLESRINTLELPAAPPSTESQYKTSL